MRIYPDLPMIRLDGLTQPLLQLFQGSSKLEGVIKEITPASILLQLGQAELELPLESSRPDVRAWLREGLKVELHRQQGVFILKAQPAASQPEPAALAVRPLDEALLALDIPPTPEALLTAKTLLEQGFPLQKEHLWVLLPWAEQGRLEEALQLLQAGFAQHPHLWSWSVSFGKNRRGRPCRNRFARSFRWSCRKASPTPVSRGALPGAAG